MFSYVYVVYVFFMEFHASLAAIAKEAPLRDRNASGHEGS